MPIEWTARFKRDYLKLPMNVQDRVERIITLLDENREHPSLHLKRLKRLPGYWELRVTKKLRVLLMIKDDLFTLAAIGTHDILDTFGKN